MADKSVLSRLRRLFSTDVIIRNIGGDQLKVMDVNSIQKSGNYETNSTIERYSRLHLTGTAPIYNPALNYQTMRVQLYRDYEAMDTDAIIASALDILADECTLKDDMGEVLSIKSTDEDIQKILYNLFYDVLNIEFNLWMWIRQMCKYGDFFLKLDIAEKFGVYNVIPYTAYNIVRLEGMNPDNPNEVKFQYDPDGLTGHGAFGGYYGGAGGGGFNPSSHYITYDNYEMTHFRLLTDANYLPYGRSYIEPGRKLFKQYTLMEDAMLLQRIMRAPAKRVYYINVGSIPPHEVDAFMEKTISKMKRVPYVDEQTGEYNLKYNVANMMEDIFIPVRGNDTSTKIDTAEGLSYEGITDVEYLRDKLLASLKIPKAFMGYLDGVEGKSTLAAMDIRFARTIDRIQRIVLSELYKIATIHLYTQGYTSEQLSNFELSLTTPSIIYEQEKIVLLKEKVEVANSIMELGLFPTDWIYDNLFRCSEVEYDEYRDLIIEDSKRKFRLTQISEEGNDPEETGKSYGTPHDLASLYGLGRMQTDPGNVPDGYNEEKPLGRPKEKASNINTQKDAFGVDRLGRKGNKKDYDSSDSIRPRFKGGSPLALEDLKKYINKKKLIFEQKSSLLDESNLKD